MNFPDVTQAIFSATWVATGLNAVSSIVWHLFELKLHYCCLLNCRNWSKAYRNVSLIKFCLRHLQVKRMLLIFAVHDFFFSFFFLSACGANTCVRRPTIAAKFPVCFAPGVFCQVWLCWSSNVSVTEPSQTGEDGATFLVDDSEVEVVYVREATAEQVALARKLMLPHTFFCYQNEPGYTSGDQTDGVYQRVFCVLLPLNLWKEIWQSPLLPCRWGLWVSRKSSKWEALPWCSTEKGCWSWWWYVAACLTHDSFSVVFLLLSDFTFEVIRFSFCVLWILICQLISNHRPCRSPPFLIKHRMVTVVTGLGLGSGMSQFFLCMTVDILSCWDAGVKIKSPRGACKSNPLFSERVANWTARE